MAYGLLRSEASAPEDLSGAAREGRPAAEASMEQSAAALNTEESHPNLWDSWDIEDPVIPGYAQNAEVYGIQPLSAGTQRVLVGAACVGVCVGVAVASRNPALTSQATLATQKVASISMRRLASPSSPVMSNLDVTVRSFASQYLKGSVNREMPAKVWDMTVRQALRYSTKARKLITDQRFYK